VTLDGGLKGGCYKDLLCASTEMGILKIDFDKYCPSLSSYSLPQMQPTSVFCLRSILPFLDIKQPKGIMDVIPG
jgi:hypothetical protein